MRRTAKSELPSNRPSTFDKGMANPVGGSPRLKNNPIAVTPHMLAERRARQDARERTAVQERQAEAFAVRSQNISSPAYAYDRQELQDRLSGALARRDELVRSLAIGMDPATGVPMDTTPDPDAGQAELEAWDAAAAQAAQAMLPAPDPAGGAGQDRASRKKRAVPQSMEQPSSSNSTAVVTMTNAQRIAEMEYLERMQKLENQIAVMELTKEKSQREAQTQAQAQAAQLAQAQTQVAQAQAQAQAAQAQAQAQAARGQPGLPPQLSFHTYCTSRTEYKTYNRPQPGAFAAALARNQPTAYLTGVGGRAQCMLQHFGEAMCVKLNGLVDAQGDAMVNQVATFKIEAVNNGALYPRFRFDQQGYGTLVVSGGQSGASPLPPGVTLRTADGAAFVTVAHWAPAGAEPNGTPIFKSPDFWIKSNEETRNPQDGRTRDSRNESLFSLRVSAVLPTAQDNPGGVPPVNNIETLYDSSELVRFVSEEDGQVSMEHSSTAILIHNVENSRFMVERDPAAALPATLRNPRPRFPSLMTQVTDRSLNREFPIFASGLWRRINEGRRELNDPTAPPAPTTRAPRAG